MANNGLWPWMALYPKDFIADRIGFSQAERGTYIMLVCAAWGRDGELPISADELSHIALCTPAIAKSTLEKLIQKGLASLDTGRLRLQIVDRDLARAKRLTEQRRRAGKRSAEVRHVAAIGPQNLEDARNE